MASILPRSLKRLVLLQQAALMLLVLVAGGLGVWYAAHWQQSSEEAVRLNTLLQGAEHIRGDMYSQVEEVIRARFTEDPSALERYTSFADDIAARFTALQRRVTARERLALDLLQDAYRVLRSDMEKVFTSPYAVTDTARIKLLDRAHEQWMLADFESALNVFNLILQRRHDELRDSQFRWAAAARIVAPLLVVFALVLVVISVHRLYREFLHPVDSMLGGVERLSNGELEHRLAEHGVDELRELARAFNHMAGELERNRDALVEKERQAALGALVPVLAHNIRNPLASIRATAQLMDARDSVEEMTRTREGIIDCVDQLERWMQSLLSYLHPLQPRRVMVTMSEVLDAACGLLAHELDARGLTIERVGFGEDEPVHIDPDLMEQAVFGLINNALEASPRGGKVTISMQNEQRRVRVSIADEGPGMSFAPQPNGLMPGPTTKAQGSGLGIPFALKVAQAHGVAIRFDCAAVGGTRVELTVPAGPSAAGAQS